MPDVYTLIVEKKWLVLVALIIGLTVRLLKSDTKIPIDLPPRLRIWVAFALGVAGGIVETISTGTPAGKAIVDGLVAAVLAIVGHNVLVDSLRGGREFVIPGLVVPGAKPSPKNPPSLPPGPMPPPSGPSIMSIVILGFVCATTLSACAKLFRVLDLAADKAKCVVAYQDLPNDVIFAKCAIQPGDFEKYLDLLSESRSATNRALERASLNRPRQIDLTLDKSDPWADAGADAGAK